MEYTSSKLSIYFYEDVLSESRASKLYEECLSHFESLYDGKIPNRRVSCVFGAMSYSVTFGSKTVEKAGDPWETLHSLPGVERRIERLLKTEFSYCVVQYYQNGKHQIKPHKDREMTSGTMIAGLSLGCERDLTMIPPKFLREESFSIKLPNNSLYVLNPPTNDYWMHSIPATNKSGGRISLTFRNL